MTRHLHGGMAADYVVEDGGSGEVVFNTGGTVKFYNQRTGGTQYTDLSLNADGSDPVTTTGTSTGGGVGIGMIDPPVYGPDEVLAMWASCDDGPRVLIMASDIADVVAGALSALSILQSSLSTHTSQVNPHLMASGDLIDASMPAIGARVSGTVMGWDGTNLTLLPPSVAAGAVLLNPPTSGGSYIGNIVTEPPPAGGQSGEPWLLAQRSYSASDSNPDFLQIKAFWSDLVTKLKTFWINGNGEVRGAPSTPGRVGARFFESYEAIGFSTNVFFSLSTNPTIAANREALLAAYGSAHSTKAGWVEMSRVASGLQGLAAGGSFNGLGRIILRGLKSTSGAPTSSAWSVGDAVIDVKGVLYLCTVAGTPGTWISSADGAYAAFADVETLSGGVLGTNVVQGSPTFQLRFGPGGQVNMRGKLAFTGSISSGATLLTWPTAYRPTRGEWATTERYTGTGAAASRWLLPTSGAFQNDSHALVNGNAVNLDDKTIWL